MRIVVTGATGFIGLHLCRLLLERGHSVLAMRRSDDQQPLVHEKLSWQTTGDLAEFDGWASLLADVTHVVHLAGLAHQVGVADGALEEKFRRANVEATRRMVMALAESCVKRLILVSSISVLEPSETLLSSASAVRPVNAYGRTKKVAEEIVQQTLLQGTPDWTILRPCLVFGPRTPGNMARLLQLLRKRVPLPFGSIRNKRSFMFVGNLADLISYCLDAPSASRKILLAGDSPAVSTPGLVEKLATHSGTPVRMVPLPISALRVLGYLGDSIRWLTGRNTGLDSYSVNKLCQSLYLDEKEISNQIGWLPPFSFDEGLAATFEADRARSDDR